MIIIYVNALDQCKPYLSIKYGSNFGLTLLLTTNVGIKLIIQKMAQKIKDCK